MSLLIAAAASARGGHFGGEERIEPLGVLARSKLDDSKISQCVTMKRILGQDGLELRTRLAEGHDDAARAWDLPSLDDERPLRVVFAQVRHVRRHVRVDFGEIHLVRELDDEHTREVRQMRSSLPTWECSA